MNYNNLTREDCGKIQWPNYHFSHRWELWPSLVHFLFQTKIIFILLLSFEPVPKLPQVETWTKIIASHIILFLFLLFEPVLVCLNLDHFLFQTKIIFILLLSFEPVPKLPQVETWTKIIASHIILFLFLLFEPVLVCLNLDHFLFQTKIIYIYFYFYLNLWPNYHRWKRALHHIYSV